MAAGSTATPPTPRPIANTRAHEGQPRVSPDGQWVAHVTEERGGLQVVVQPLAGPGARVHVSRSGGESLLVLEGEQKQLLVVHDRGAEVRATVQKEEKPR